MLRSTGCECFGSVCSLCYSRIDRKPSQRLANRVRVAYVPKRVWAALARNRYLRSHAGSGSQIGTGWSHGGAHAVGVSLTYILSTYDTIAVDFSRFWPILDRFGSLSGLIICATKVPISYQPSFAIFDRGCTSGWSDGQKHD